MVYSGVGVSDGYAGILWFNESKRRTARRGADLYLTYIVKGLTNLLMLSDPRFAALQATISIAHLFAWDN